MFDCYTLLDLWVHVGHTIADHMHTKYECRPHTGHTHNSATLNGHVQFPFRFGCNPVTLSSFRKARNPKLASRRHMFLADRTEAVAVPPRSVLGSP
jgi:hypothetical protein